LRSNNLTRIRDGRIAGAVAVKVYDHQLRAAAALSGATLSMTGVGLRGVNRQPQAGRREGQTCLPAKALSGTEAHTRLNGSAAASQVDLPPASPVTLQHTLQRNRPAPAGLPAIALAACGLAGWLASKDCVI